MLRAPRPPQGLAHARPTEAWVVLALFALLTLQACDPAPEGGSAEVAAQHPGWPLDFVELRRFALEENDSVLNVLPFMTEVNADGTLVFADQGDARVRLYSPEGTLLRQLGRRGEGPDEFTLPFAAHWAGDDRVIVADVIRGVAIWDASSGRVESRLDRDGRLTFAARSLSDSLMVVGAYAPAAPDPMLLRLVRLPSGVVEREFFPIPIPTELRPAATQVGGVVLALDGDEILAAFTLSDTVFTFDSRGVATRRFHVPIPGFSQDPGNGVADVRIIRSIFPADSMLVIQYGSAPPAPAVHGLVMLDRSGTVLGRWENTPQLLGIRWPEFHFLDPGSDLPNRVVVGQLRR